MAAFSFRLNDLTSTLQDTLRRYSFDESSFTRLQSELAQGQFPLERNQFQGSVLPPEPASFTPWPVQGSQDWHHYEALGLELIAQNKVAMVILNGGMATRFGGKVKGIVEVLPGASFLQLKLAPVPNFSSPVPIFLMNSFSTDQATQQHLAQIAPNMLKRGQIHCFNQGIALRLRPDGQLLTTNDGQPSLYAPGHGDVLWALAQQPAFQAWYQQDGSKVVLISNVDNLGATLSPVALGLHQERGQPITVEVAAKTSQDTGGAPVLIDGHLEILEGFRFPPTFDPSTLKFFNTNTFWLQAKLLTQAIPLTWFRADKTVEGQTAVQFERLLGEISHWYPGNYQQVPRTGPESRFLPVKQPGDVASIVPYAQILQQALQGAIL